MPPSFGVKLQPRTTSLLSPLTPNPTSRPRSRSSQQTALRRALAGSAERRPASRPIPSRKLVSRSEVSRPAHTPGIRESPSCCPSAASSAPEGVDRTSRAPRRPTRSKPSIPGGQALSPLAAGIVRSGPVGGRPSRQARTSCRPARSRPPGAMPMPWAWPPHRAPPARSGITPRPFGSRGGPEPHRPHLRGSCGVTASGLPCGSTPSPAPARTLRV